VAARALLTIAFQIQSFQLSGEPVWVRDTYYDVNAKPAETATREQTFTMLQALLVERFKLAFHRETRELDGYALVQARPGALGPQLHHSTVDCEKVFASEPRCREGGISDSALKATGAHLWTLLQIVTGQLLAPVNDDTQLTGTFDFDLRWSNDVAPSDNLPSFSTALQEQLGLKLERRRVPSDIFVVDRIEHPTPD
jgi:uncharacterized protein (TIGR03435 family)